MGPAYQPDLSEDVRTEWRGIEKEGRWAGLPTTFLTRLIPLHEILDPHIYLCPQVIQKDQWDTIARFVGECKAANKVCTVAVQADDALWIHPYVLVNAHIMVEVCIRAVTALKPTDEIKVLGGPYETYSVAKCQMVKTGPEAYAEDKELEAYED